jgi:hypothetical protein
MEFLEIVDASIPSAELQELKIGELDKYCSEINNIINVETVDRAKIYCGWGEFCVERQLIKGGVRFSLPECPNALAWTITTGFEPAPDKVIIHCTINRLEHDEDFIESIELFVKSWKIGLEALQLEE